MERPIVACIQHRLLVTEAAGDYDAHLHRFLRTAKAKGASLALFPELSGLAYAIPIFSGWRNSLLKSAEKGRDGRSSVWQRTKSKLAGGAATVVKADLRQSLIEALQVMPESLRDAYTSGFSNLAQQYEMTIVAGSLYEIDAETNQIYNVSLVFGPDGELIGRQAKVVLNDRDEEVTQAAAGWGMIPTPAGRLGILLGNDVLYPEPARILAYQGADMLLSMGAVTKPATYHKIRQAALARCQENQLYGMVSFLVGPDPFAADDAPPFVGKSAIFAPLEFTRRFTGVMVEVGSPMAEGVVTAEWDYPALEELWQNSDTPLRREMPLLQAGPILATVYSRALPLADHDQLMLDAPEEAPEDEIWVAGADDSATDSADVYEVEPDQIDDADTLPTLIPIFPDSALAPTQADLDDAADAVVTDVELEASKVDEVSEGGASAVDEASEQVQDALESAPDDSSVQTAAVAVAASKALDGESPVEPEQPESVTEAQTVESETEPVETTPEPASQPVEPEPDPPSESQPASETKQPDQRTTATVRPFRWPWQRR